jgi:hypothetical protein
MNYKLNKYLYKTREKFNRTCWSQVALFWRVSILFYREKECVKELWQSARLFVLRRAFLKVHEHLCEGGRDLCLYRMWSLETLLMKHKRL